MNEARERLDRAARLLAIRNTFASAAEQRVKDAAAAVENLREVLRQNLERETAIRSETARWESFSGYVLHIAADFGRALRIERTSIEKRLEAAQQAFESVRLEWVEARREQRVAEKLQERRLQEVEILMSRRQQKLSDDHATMKFARIRSAEAARAE